VIHGLLPLSPYSRRVFLPPSCRVGLDFPPSTKAFSLSFPENYLLLLDKPSMCKQSLSNECTPPFPVKDALPSSIWASRQCIFCVFSDSFRLFPCTFSQVLPIVSSFFMHCSGLIRIFFCFPPFFHAVGNWLPKTYRRTPLVFLTYLVLLFPLWCL